MVLPIQRTVSLVMLVLVSGCAAPPAPVEKQPVTQAPPVTSFRAAAAAAVSASKDAQPMVRYVVQLDVYQLTVPYGTVSNNIPFWKRVNEDNIDVGVRDVLYLNGLRVGQAPIAEWSYFKAIIDENPTVSQQSTFVASEAKSVEMPMRKGIRSQTIFICNPTQESSGRSYDECDNIVSLSFWPAPRKNGDLRVKLCPMVRGLRKKIESTLLDGQREFQFVSPEHLYDLKLCADVPLGSFLIVAPSEYAKAPTTVGNAFLLKDGPTDREEQLLILVPRIYGAKPVVNASATK